MENGLIQGDAFARRAILKKEGHADVRFEMQQDSPVSFRVLENGRQLHVFWTAISPTQAIWGGAPDANLDRAWQHCLLKLYPGFEATAVEDGFSIVAG